MYPDLALYRLRHVFASFVKNILTESQIKLTIGHSASLNTDIYIHELNKDHIKTGQAINNLFNLILEESENSREQKPHKA